MPEPQRQKNNVCSVVTRARLALVVLIVYEMYVRTLEKKKKKAFVEISQSHKD